MTETNNGDDARMIVMTRQVREDILKMEKEFISALPSSVAIKLFMRATLTAVNNDPWLLRADRRSLLGAATRAAQDGLLPDGREGAFVVYNAKAPKQNKADRDVWIKKVQWMPMVYGIIKKMRNSGELSMLTSRVVYGGDKFRYWIDDKGEHLEYEPADEPDTSVIRRVFAMAITKDGAVYAEPMTAQEVEKVRASSKANDSGPWKDWWEEMAKKTAIRRLSKRMPMSAEVDQVLRRDDNLYDMRGHNSGQTFIPITNPLKDTVESDDSKTIEHQSSDRGGGATSPWENEQNNDTGEDDKANERSGPDLTVAGGANRAHNEAARVIDENGVMSKDDGSDKPAPILDYRFDEPWFASFESWLDECVDAEFATRFSASTGQPLEEAKRRTEPEQEKSTSNQGEKIDTLFPEAEKTAEASKKEAAAQQQAATKTEPAATSGPRSAPEDAPYANAAEYVSYMDSFFEAVTSETKLNEEWATSRTNRNNMLSSDQIEAMTKKKAATLKRIRAAK